MSFKSMSRSGGQFAIFWICAAWNAPFFAGIHLAFEGVTGNDNDGLWSLMSHSPHARSSELGEPRRTYYHPDDGLRGADSLVPGGTGAAALAAVRPALERIPAKKGLYLPVRAKFAIALAAATLWASVSFHFAQVWLVELAG